MAVSHASASQDLSSKFGATPVDVPALLQATRAMGAEPALAFNVGSGVREPQAYAYALEIAADVLERLDFRLRLLDIGGGFPRQYPDFAVPPVERYFEAVRTALHRLPLAQGAQVFCEPGRALAAPGMSALVEVLQRKGDRLVLNDGMYGAFWELRFGMQGRYPVRAYREAQALSGPATAFRLYGPTCDSTDVLPARVELPAGIRAGDHLEFGAIGAYSLAGRTRFNGHFSTRMALIDGAGAMPPE
jgi:ornithine decarboxylase